MALIYSNDIFGVERYGGISRYYFELIRRISPKIGNVKVMAGWYINEYIKSMREVKGIKLPALKHTGFIRLGINKIFQEIMLMRADRQDILHQTFFHQPFIRFPGKVVVTVYDMISEIFPQYYPSGDKNSLLKRQCCERADKVIAISHSTKNDLVSLFGISPGKIVVTQLASSLKCNNITESIKPFPKPYLLFVGKRQYYKNFEGLMDAFAASDSLKNSFHIVCFGGGPLSNKEYVRLKEMGIEDRVHNVTGSDALLGNYYRNAVAYICPSLYEGFGIPILEAMEFACPVVCSHTSSLPEVAGDAAIYFDPSESGSLQEALETTLFDKILLEGLKKRGLERQAMFSWDRCAQETLDVYNTLLQ
jgi:glycosyltransferase involved in cell wall biosynthesis